MFHPIQMAVATPERNNQGFVKKNPNKKVNASLRPTKWDGTLPFWIQIAICVQISCAFSEHMITIYPQRKSQNTKLADFSEYISYPIECFQYVLLDPYTHLYSKGEIFIPFSQRDKFKNEVFSRFFLKSGGETLIISHRISLAM